MRIENYFNRRLLTDIYAFRYYRKKAKKRNMEHTKRWEHHGKYVTRFWEKVGEKMIENPHGVSIEHLGYFTVIMNPQKTGAEWLGKDYLLNSHTDGRQFHPIFLPIVNDTLFKLFIMDKGFVRQLKGRLSKNLKEGKKYFNHFGILYSMYKNKR